MKFLKKIICIILAVAGFLGTWLQGRMHYTALNQQYEAVSAANPLKGFFPFSGVYTNGLEYSMEWCYFPLCVVMDGKDSYTFEGQFEQTLNEIAARGHQAALRIYLDYPADGLGSGAVPQFVWDMGVRAYPYDTYGGGVSPDYSDQRLLDILVNLIAEMGKCYDGDARIGYITCGLIGHWGECHVSDGLPFPSDEQMDMIFAAYDKAFDTTKIVARIPSLAHVTEYNIGFHDDSFAYSTLSEFVPVTKKEKAGQKWKKESIGGEFRPELQPDFIAGIENEDTEDYYKCVRKTHCSWLIMHKAFTGTLTQEEIKRTAAASNALGYDLYVKRSFCLRDVLSVTIRNAGVAPFYYKWNVNIGFLKDGKLLKSVNTGWDITRILPGRAKTYSLNLNDAELEEGEYTLVMQVENPLVGGCIFRFANDTMNRDAYGYITLGTVQYT